MFNIELQKLAYEDLDLIFWYISDDNKIIAVQVIQKINKSIQNLKTFPYLWKKSGILREFVESKYKFRIIYNVNEDKKIITIISIFKNKNNF